LRDLDILINLNVYNPTWLVILQVKSEMFNITLFIFIKFSKLLLKSFTIYLLSTNLSFLST